MSLMLLFFFEKGRDVMWKDGVLEGFFFYLPWVLVFAWIVMYTIQKWLTSTPEWWHPQVFSLATGTRMSLAVNHMDYRSDLLSSRVSVACCAQNQPLRIPQNRCFKHRPKRPLGVALSIVTHLSFHNTS